MVKITDRSNHSRLARPASDDDELFGMGTKASRKRMLEKDPDDVPLGQLRLRTIFVASAMALDELRPDRALPVRHGFTA
jgi:hypothetical protein